MQSIKSFDEDIGKSVGSKKYSKGKLYEYIVDIGLPEIIKSNLKKEYHQQWQPQFSIPDLLKTKFPQLCLLSDLYFDRTVLSETHG